MALRYVLLVFILAIGNTTYGEKTYQFRSLFNMQHDEPLTLKSDGRGDNDLEVEVVPPRLCSNTSLTNCHCTVISEPAKTSPAIDVIFMIDCSLCFRDHFQDMIKWLDVARTRIFGKVNAENSHFAIMMFGNDGKAIPIDWELSDDIRNQTAMKDTIQNLSFCGKTSALNEALDQASEHITNFRKTKNPNYNNPTTIVILTDGNSNKGVTNSQVSQSVATLTAMNVTIQPVTVTMDPNDDVFSILTNGRVINKHDVIPMQRRRISKLLDAVMPQETSPAAAYGSADCTCDANCPVPVKGDKGDIGQPGPTGPQGPQGDPGTKGSRGRKGVKGDLGEKGFPGRPGPQGPTGAVGLKGDKGTGGLPGLNGAPGDNGDRGDFGPKGPKGDKGIDGLKGKPGSDGKDGKRGEKGNQGIPGIGIKGDVGPKGNKGSEGWPGPKGPVGPSGKKGVRGCSGCQGAPGVVGPKGNTGEPGLNGFNGISGPPGIQGPPGPPGYQGSKGDVGLPGPMGISGPAGMDGLQGPPGPQGLKGNRGDVGPASVVPGPTGPRGYQGDKGEVGLAGTNGIGMQGPPGLQGPRGKTGSKGECGIDINQIEIIVWEMIIKLYNRSGECGKTCCNCGVSSPPKDECTNRAMIDLTILLDGSGSINKEDFSKLKTWIINMLHSIKAGEMKIPLFLTIVQYSANTQTESKGYICTASKRGGCDNLADVEEKISNMVQLNSYTNTWHALNEVVNDPGTRSGRQRAKKVLVTITDGNPTDGDDKVLKTNTIQLAKAMYNERVVVGVGHDLNTANFPGLHSKKENLHYVDDYDGLENLITSLTETICTGSNEGGDGWPTDYEPSPPDVGSGYDYSLLTDDEEYP